MFKNIYPSWIDIANCTNLCYNFFHFLTKFVFLFFAYIRTPYDMPVAAAAFLKESNVVGLMPSEEIVNVCLSYIGLKPNLSFKSFNLCSFLPLNPLLFMNSLNSLWSGAPEPQAPLV